MTWDSQYLETAGVERGSISGEEGVVWRLLGIQRLYRALGGNAWANLLAIWKCEAIYYPQSTSPTPLPLNTHKKLLFFLSSSTSYQCYAIYVVGAYYAMSMRLDWVCEVLSYWYHVDLNAYHYSVSHVSQFVPECPALMNRWVFAFTHNAFNLSNREGPSFNTATMSSCADSLYSSTVWLCLMLLTPTKVKRKIPFDILNGDSFWTPAI